MQNDHVATHTGYLRRLWASRRSFKGFGMLLFYCHMLMLFSALVRINFADIPELALLVKAGTYLVPAAFTLTTFSLFIPAFFWGAVFLGTAHLFFAAAILIIAPINPLPWLGALIGLCILLWVSLRWKLSARKFSTFS